MVKLNCREKIIKDYERLAQLVKAHKILGEKIVCTVGTWDILHIGHLRYLEKAKRKGDILVVGVDSDRGVKFYKKNPLRPIIPQEERMEMLSYQGFIDYVTLIDDITPRGVWKLSLIKKIRPDIFVATKESFPDSQLKRIEKYCKRLVLQRYEAKRTSTSKVVQKVFKKKLKYILSNLKHT